MRIYINTEYLLEHSFKTDDGIPFRQKLYQKMILITLNSRNFVPGRKMPSIIVADDAFSLKNMKPYTFYSE